MARKKEVDLEVTEGLNGVGRMEGKSLLITVDSESSDATLSTKRRIETTIDTANWMKDLDGELYLSALTIPGTHDSYALVGTPIILIESAKKAAECQDWNIATQLQNGIRCLDFRYGDDLRMRHGQVELPGKLPECLQIVSVFLDAHPQETVIVMAKWDKWGFITNEGIREPDATRTAADKAFTNLTRFQDVTSTPRLKDVRGKIIRKKDGSSTQGLDFDAAKRDSMYSKPTYNRPQYQLSKDLSSEENTWAERLYAISGVWAQAEHRLNWIRDVRPQALAEAVAKDNVDLNTNKKTNVMAVKKVWDYIELSSFQMDFWTVITSSMLYPVDMAKSTNRQLHSWVAANQRWD